jgi:phosphoadenosine phosphosulfate reductase
VAFSGGKDSITVLDLVKRAGVKYDAHYNLTTVDPPELVRFIKTFIGVQIHRPELSMWQIIQKELMPPTRIARYCCRVLKEGGGEGRKVITGIRWAESVKRTKRRMVENCLRGGSKTFLNPVIDWKNYDTWDYIRERKLSYCSLYDEGFKRLGCIMCPMGKKRGMLRDSKRWPKYYNAYLRAFGKMLAQGKNRNWKTAQDVMDWWIYQPPKGDPDQGVMFE